MMKYLKFYKKEIAEKQCRTINIQESEKRQENKI